MFLLAKITLGSAAAIAALDPAWSLPLNSALLIVLTVVTFIIGKRQKDNHAQTDEKVTAIADMTANAATAAMHAAGSAADAARISKDLGGQFRETRVPPGTTDTTENTGK